jgi:hypothetical protein
VIGSNSIVQLKFSGLFFGHAYLVAIEASFAEAWEIANGIGEMPFMSSRLGSNWAKI